MTNLSPNDALDIRVRRSARLAAPKGNSRQASESSQNGSSIPPDVSEQSDVSCKAAPSSRKRNSARIGAKPEVSPLDVEKFVNTPLTPDQRDNWGGWVELESDPAFFNVMLRDFGVEGVKVQEVLSLDEDMVAFLPKPIYGLILLLQYVEEEEEEVEECPEQVWFANQTISNACATIALLNIIMNITDAEIGPTMWSLKDFTKTMTPALRGYTVSTSSFIKKVHNSFATKMETLNADLSLQNEFEESKRKKKRGKKKKNMMADDAAFHFIAFVPIEGCVWRLDGLDRNPRNLGPYSGDWMTVARLHIQALMMQQESDGTLNFTLLSLCRSPLLSIPVRLALNIKSLRAIESRLDKGSSDWRIFVQEEESGVLHEADTGFAVTHDMIKHAEATEDASSTKSGDTGIAMLMETRTELVSVQASLRRSYLEELAAVNEDNERAAARRHDYTPMIHMWIKALAENGMLRDICESLEES